MYSLTHTEHQFIYRLIKGLCSFSTLRLFCSLVQMIVHLASQFLVVLYTYNWGSWMIPRDYSVGALSFLSVTTATTVQKLPEKCRQEFPLKSLINVFQLTHYVLNLQEQSEQKRSWQLFNGIITKANPYADYWTVFILSYRRVLKLVSEKGHFIINF